MSYEKDGRIHIEDDDAMAGSKSGKVRWVLLFSLLAAIVILSAIWMSGALLQDDTPAPAQTTEAAAE